MDWSQSHTNDAIEHPAQSPTSDSHQQPLSWLPIYESRLQAKLQEVTQKLSTLSTSINVSALAHDPSSSLHAHYQILLRACNFKFPETRTVGFIGDSGVDKLSVSHPMLRLVWPY